MIKFFISLLLLFGYLFGQLSEPFYHISPSNVISGNDTEILVVLEENDKIRSGSLFFRQIDEISYQEVNMDFENGSWIGLIPGARVFGSFIEYVVIFQKMDGGQIGVPLAIDPFASPLNFSVSMSAPNLKVQNKDKTSANDYIDADILILSPEPGSLNKPDEIVISLSLFNAPIVDQNEYILYLDGVDVTKKSLIDGEVLTFIPEDELSVGLHKIKVLFKSTYGLDINPVKWNFNISKGTLNMADSFKYKGFLNGKNSRNTASRNVVSELLYNGKIEGELSWVKADFSLKKSSRESIYMQPLDRSTLSLRFTDYATLETGDTYPSLSPYILDGKRVRGQYLKLNLPYIKLQYVKGLLNRAVQYQDKINGALEIIEDNTSIASNGGKIYSFTRKGYTFPRDILAARLAINAFKSFTTGIHFMKVKDDFSKISLKVPASTFFDIDSSLDNISEGVYSYSDFLLNVINPLDTVVIINNDWDDGKPIENLAIGFDLEKAFDNRQLTFQMAWNMTWTNNNISEGFISLDDADVLLDTLDDNAIMDIPIDDFPDPATYKDIITIHPLYMVPLVPLDPITFEKNPIRAILNMPSSAYNIRLKGSYSLNNVLIEYRHIGPEYYSYGNPYLTNNIREFIINDRLSLLGRRLMLLVGYKYKDNSLSENVANPLKTRTMTLNTTLVPGPGAVSLIFNLRSINQTNGIDSLEMNSYGDILGDNRENSQAINSLVSINIPSSGPNSSSTIALNVNSISYRDNLEIDRQKNYLFQKSNMKNYSANISSRFNNSLKTSVSLNKTIIYTPFLIYDGSNKKGLTETSWLSLSSKAQYEFPITLPSTGWLDEINSIFENQLLIKAGLDYMTNGKNKDEEIEIFGIKIGLELDIIKNLVLSTNASMRLNKSIGNTMDGVDNDNNGEIDDKGEKIIINNSGVFISLGYRF